MENDANRTNLTIIIVLLITIVGISVFYIINHFFIEDKKTNDNYEEEEIIENETNIPPNNYNVYGIGDAVSLIDSSNWHVIKQSGSNVNTVTLLKDTRISSYIKYSEANEYLNHNYRKVLRDSLGSTDNYISEVRLLRLSDIEDITSIDHLSIDTVIENNQYSFLYQDITLIDGVTNQNNPLLICQNDGVNPAKICEGIGNEIWAVRPVVTVHKSLLK